MSPHSGLSPGQKILAEQFGNELAKLLDRLERLDGLEAIVGIPFHEEADTLAGVVGTARRGLESAGLSGRSAVVCVGSRRIGHLLDHAATGGIRDAGVPVIGEVVGNGFEGRSWSALALAHAAAREGVPLVILPPNISPQPDAGDEPGQGFAPHWIARLLQAVRDGAGLALARYSLHPLAHPVESLIVYPLVTGALGQRVRQAIPGVAAISPRLLSAATSKMEDWSFDAGHYGFDPWLFLEAATTGTPIVEVPLGVVSFRHDTGRLKAFYRQTTHVLFERLARRADRWIDRESVVSSPAAALPFVDGPPPALKISGEQLRREFWVEFDRYEETLYPRILPREILHRFQQAEHTGKIALTDDEWARLIEEFFLAFRFESDFHRDDVLDGLFPFLLAKLATLVEEVDSLSRAIPEGGPLGPGEAEAVVRGRIERRFDALADASSNRWTLLQTRWREHEERTRPYLPRLGVWEFVPNVGIIVPQELEVAGGKSVWAYQVYKTLLDRYREEYRSFVTGELGVGDPNETAAVIDAVTSFMTQLEEAIDEELLPGELASVEVARRLADQVVERLADRPAFYLVPDAAEKILRRVPPANLFTQFAFRDAGEMIERLEPNDALAMAAWTDQQPYLTQALDFLEREVEPDWFGDAPIEARTLELGHVSNAPELGGAAPLGRLAGRAVVSNSLPGAGGRLPKVWFLLRLAKFIVSVEVYSELWREFAGEDDGFSRHLLNSIRGHWGRRALSAHNAFQNRQQRMMAERLRRLADRLTGDPGTARAGRLLRAASGVYHLSVTLPDATFVPLSAWTWASQSSRGSVGTPTPLSSLVERDWATRDFFTLYLEAAGRGDAGTIDRKITELIREGRESEDLREHLLEVSADPDELLVSPSVASAPAAARKLDRPLDRPLLSPTENPWESRYVLNAAAVRLDGTVYILYRAFGADEISRIGLAWTKDGIHIDGRLDQPIFAPGDPSEAGGCEDPRVVVIDGRLCMLYTAYDRKLPQIAMASIPVDAFLERRFDQWTRHGLAYPGLPNKDAVLYPERFDGRFAVYHRIDPNMWVSYMDQLTCPWPREGHRVIAGPRSGMMWDGVKIGAGGQPIKTTKGWLNIYHGVDFERSYRLGVLFMAADDPAEVLYRSPNAVLEPETDYELGGGGSWVPNVVFTCGAVPARDTDIVGPDDEILVYYGAADTVIGVARGKVRDMVPVFDTLDA